MRGDAFVRLVLRLEAVDHLAGRRVDLVGGEVRVAERHQGVRLRCRDGGQQGSGAGDQGDSAHRILRTIVRRAALESRLEAELKLRPTAVD